MITATGVELRAGARLLLDGATFRVGPGDRVGLVGRNGAGKTTLTRVLAGRVGCPPPGRSSAAAAVGYLPQDPRTGDLEVLARDRVLSGRGLDVVVSDLRAAEDWRWPTASNKAIELATATAQERLHVLGGYAAEAEAASVAASLGLPDRVLGQPLRTLSGGQRRRVELARILFSGADTLLLDEPTNHLDADSIVWLRDFLRSHRGGLVVISHDVELLEVTVNRVFHLDANRAALDIYNVGWRTYLLQRETDERRRKPRARQRREEGRGAQRPGRPDAGQGDEGRRGAADGDAGRASCWPVSRTCARSDKVAKLRFPEPAPCGTVPLHAAELSKSYGSLEVFTDVDLAIDRGSRVVVLGLNGAGKTTLLRHPRRRRAARHRRGACRPRAAARLLRSGARDARSGALGAGEPRGRRREPARGRAAQGARVVPVQRRHRSGSRPGPCRAARRPGWRWPCWWSRAPTCCCSTSRPTTSTRPAASRCFSALRSYGGAIVLVTHDEGAVEALEPERVLLLPDGVEDHWSADLADLVALA